MVITHVQVDETLVHCDGLGDGLGSIVAALVIGQVKGLQGAVVALEVLGDGFAPSERDFVGVEVQHLQGGVLEQMLHDDVETVISQLVLPHGDLLQSNVVLKHLTEMNSHTLANGLVDRILDI